MKRAANRLHPFAAPLCFPVWQRAFSIKVKSVFPRNVNPAGLCASCVKNAPQSFAIFFLLFYNVLVFFLFELATFWTRALFAETE
ncbi:hypothetical protein C3438_07555 [Bacillus velezensis]|uniref:Transporter n=1 Tax=Bacillus velezensis TaxID=492670 RepID=A0ABC8DDG5_BACVE|nr:hypothetical protein KO64_17710 [Bacillus subtilis]ANB85385.1 hypothetical protein A6R78_15835 [Bacillus velezensis]ARM29535.1 hypothetical protein B9C48_17565 [Bacillus vallismortis]AWM53403.1 hypothetical protein DDT10_17720 [Bacillus amyloliquefaciens]OXS82558.1 hypothetical protein B1726_14030 [Bacillus sp. LYLB4]